MTGSARYLKVVVARQSQLYALYKEDSGGKWKWTENS
jgi:hypothetical protein